MAGKTAIMSEDNKNSLEQILPQLRCHFTWNLFKEESVPHDLEERVCNQTEFLNSEFKATKYNLLAYIKHLKGQNKAALQCLQQAEECIRREHADQAEVRSLVTWGNYAWVYYHLGRFAEAQVYADKVKQVCQKFSNPYSIECPELDCEEGWTLVKCGGKKIERAKVYFQKALEEKPNNPEFSSGLAIAMYYLDERPEHQSPVEILRQAVELSPDDQYIKVLLALTLQKMNEQAEGEQLVVEALGKSPCQTDVLCSAAKFYQGKGDLDKTIELLLRALESIPNNAYLYHQIACCYEAKVKQIQHTGASEASQKGEKIEELRKHARNYVSKATEKGPNPPHAYADELLENKDCYETAFSKELPSTKGQELHQHDCSPQEDHEISEDTAVQCSLDGLSISTKSTEKEKMIFQLQNVAKNQLPQNGPYSWSLQGLIHKMNGELLQAAECYEKALDHLLRNRPSGIGSIFLPATEHEEGSEEMEQDADSSRLRELPDP
ncbi:interferon-induced protein with tetratricopeptide repeats 3 [Budorcas taxicolor]|uniref:interferon-induced protein with tetratricopeptide repeats 3 n=1 Tax=Budorcas taxicolor TaxID=37181 RepID=UPI0022851897|nr:interferon-induced protein with tetratricopeptide repeats 3 [Budorcas taxicolor]